MRAEGKELFLATFFSFAAAAVIGLFWAGQDLSPESSVASKRSPVTTAGTGIRIPGGLGAPLPQSIPSPPEATIALPPAPPSWLGWTHGGSPWASSPSTDPGLEGNATVSGRGDHPPEPEGRPPEWSFASANPTQDERNDSSIASGPSPGFSADPEPLAAETGAPGPTAGMAPEGACADSDFCRLPELAGETSASGASSATSESQSAELATNSPAVALDEQAPSEGALNVADNAPLSNADEVTADNFSPAQADQPPLGAGLQARPTSQGTAQGGESGSVGGQTTEESPSSPAVKEPPSCAEPCPPCRCGCWPRCRRICVPRPGWVPPCGFFPYLRRLLDCAQTAPLAEGMSERMAELANSLAALFRDVRGDALVGGAGFQLEAVPAVGNGSVRRSWQAQGETPDFFRLRQSGSGGPSRELGPSQSGDDLAVPSPDQAEAVRRRAGEMLAELEALRQRLIVLGDSTENPQDGAMMRRAAHALARRLPVWQEVVAGRPFALEIAEAIEQYEAAGSPHEGTRLARLIETRARTLGEDQVHRQLEDYFRNGNIRWEVSETLLNRWAKPQPVRTHRIRDYILGRPVFGESETVSQVRFALVPDPHRLRCRLVVTGQIRGLTQSLAGPATFFDRTYGNFVGWKEIELTERGLQIGAPQVRANQRVELRGLKTDFDGIPLLGAIAHEIALAQRERSMPEATAEARQKLIARITQQFEAEASPRLARLEELVERRLLRPANRLGLQPAIVQASTLEDRLVARWRVAAFDQLGANTPRPRLPAEAMASFQIHQSAVNNVLARLQLAGRTFTPAELQSQLAELLDWPELVGCESSREDVVISFAPADPVMVHFQEGRVTIELQVARLEKQPHVWENFRVRVSYRPETVDGQPAFVRDGVVSLSGESLSLKDQLALRGIFSKRFSKEKTWPILPKLFRESPEFADVRLCHLVLEDGWFSWAVAASEQRPDQDRRASSERIASAEACRSR
ncbi:MAG: hypothetical protein NZ899_06255 [Thermoguttaceae bacterium]|nr:hypothetical protein [Thermoguttaceae bacterium]MDW8079238.1 hypothetical protein [Thermoguttaceae bacterium]